MLTALPLLDNMKDSIIFYLFCTEEAAASTEIDVLPHSDLSSPSDDIPTDGDITSKGPWRGPRRSRPAGAGMITKVPFLISDTRLYVYEHTTNGLCACLY